MNKDFVERIIKNGGIGMGLVKAKLEEWEEISRCYRCSESGHLTKECKGEDRSGVCLKCGKKDGHNVKMCSNEDYCLLCQRPGYRAGSGLCVKMRTMLNKIKKQTKERRTKTAIR